MDRLEMDRKMQVVRSAYRRIAHVIIVDMIFLVVVGVLAKYIKPGFLPFLLLFFCVGGLLIYNAKASYWACPNCRNYFWHRWVLFSYPSDAMKFFDKKCVHCGFPEGY